MSDIETAAIRWACSNSFSAERFDEWLEQHDMEVREETRQEAYHDGYSRGFEDGYSEGFAAHDFYDDWVYNAEDNE